MSGSTRKRVGGIAVAIVVLGGLVFLIGESLRTEKESPKEQLQALRTSRAALMDHSRRAGLAVDMQPASGIGLRSLTGYYALRAYAGAPPSVPHEIDAEVFRTQSCNICHERGGFVAKFNAYTPVTSHPQYANCLQCHARSGEGRFVEIDWKSTTKPVLHRPALPGNPPPIPHALQLRENCLACHAVPAAVPEVRTSHPERLNCRQCHVPRQVQNVFTRPVR
jgi:cytochrome c-type protein NapB